MVRNLPETESKAICVVILAHTFNNFVYFSSVETVTLKQKRVFRVLNDAILRHSDVVSLNVWLES